MKRLSFCLFLLLCGTCFAGREEKGEAAGVQSEWTDESIGQGVHIQSRTRAGSSFKEFRAMGEIEAPPATVFAVIDDAESYPQFMPYTAEVRILQREKNSLLAYQRLDLPMVSDRDYTLLSKNEKWQGPEGTIYRVRWQPANDRGPCPQRGVARVNVCDGGWLLEPAGKGGTRATYSIFTDNGGALPAFLANNASRIAIRKIFEALRKQVKQAKYSSAAAQASTTR